MAININSDSINAHNSQDIKATQPNSWYMHSYLSLKQNIHSCPCEYIIVFDLSQRFLMANCESNTFCHIIMQKHTSPNNWAIKVWDNFNAISTLCVCVRLLEKISLNLNRHYSRSIVLFSMFFLFIFY